MHASIINPPICVSLLKIIFSGYQTVTAGIHITNLEQIFKIYITKVTMLSSSAEECSGISTKDWEVLVTLNRPLPLTAHKLIHNLFEEQCKVQPNTIAVISWDGDLTYSHLDTLSTQLATHLIQAGVKVEMIVPLIFEKSKWMIVSMLAVMKAGGAFLAVDPNQPLSRTQGILEQVDAKIGLTSSTYLHLQSCLDLKLLHVSSIEQQQWPRTSLPTNSLIKPTNCAYVIFTSGSTGSPKGIAVEHKSFCSGVAVHAPAQFMNCQSRVLQFAAYTHDTCLVETLTTLIVGGTICVPSEEQRKNGLVEFINVEQVNWAVLTPSFITSIEPDDVPTLKVVVLAGERLSASNVSLWSKSVHLLSGYGVSECSVVTTISKPMTSETKHSNIGTPAGGMCWIVDPLDHNKLVPIGCTGEILVEGPTVCRGYIKNPEATIRAFIETPKWLRIALPGTDQNRLYKTGDLGRINHDGTLEFISRKDSQIKISGRRIELGEIEHHVSEHEAVKLCMVAFPGRGAHSNRLVAILQLHNSQACENLNNEITTISKKKWSSLHFEEGNIRQFIANKISAYMVPAVWILIEQFPRLPSAKIDRRKISEWLESSLFQVEVLDEDMLIPQDDEIAITIAREAKRAAGENDNNLAADEYIRDGVLSSYGVDSIKAISLMRSLQKIYGVKLRVEDLVANTARPISLAKCIRTAHKNGSKELVSLPRDLKKDFEEMEARLSKILETKAQFKPTAPLKVPTKVLLTGATGYLGREILRQLLQYGSSEVVALVRASSVPRARHRITQHPNIKTWWSSKYDSRLYIWLGDQSKANLGLSKQSWDQILGRDPQEDNIHAIVHNGSVVHWTADLNTLWSANVAATVILLKAAIESRSIQSLVYVSGGAHVDGSLDELASLPDAYSQTKLLSQALVQALTERSKKSLGLRLSVVKPGFIIGSTETGVANTSDYLWRFVATAVDLGVYNKDAREAWLSLSTVDIVAGLICWHLSAPDSQVPELSSISQDAIQECDLWDVLVDELGYKLQGVTHEEWTLKVRENLDSMEETHLLWPLYDVLEKQDFTLGRLGTRPLNTKDSDHKRLRGALKSNVLHLARIGFMSKAC
jgi:amino acid adenylation domain-containing protein/thioester reductase-like protein